MRVLWRNQAGQGAYTVSDLTAEKVCKHTPGPWKLDDDDAVIGITDDGGNIVCLGPEGWEKSMARWEANARLIAAAPELLEALQSIVGELDEGEVWGSSITKAKAAIAKATGEA